MKSMPYTKAGRSTLVVAAALTVVLSACTSVEVDPEAGATERLSRPDRVLVYNFAVTPQEIEVDAIGSEITKEFDGTAASAQEQQIGRAVADPLAKHLVSSINDMVSMRCARPARYRPSVPIC